MKKSLELALKAIFWEAYEEGKFEEELTKERAEAYAKGSEGPDEDIEEEWLVESTDEWIQNLLTDEAFDNRKIIDILKDKSIILERFIEDI